MRGLCHFACLCLALCGCSHVPAATIYELWNFDVSKADASALRAAVRLPAGLRPQPGGVVLSVTIKDKGKATKHEFRLEQTQEASEIARLAVHGRHGSSLYAFRLAAADVERVRQLQKTQNNGGGEIGISAKACHTRELSRGAILSSTYLQVDATRGYLTILDDLDLRAALKDVDIEKEIPPCATP